MGRTKSNQTRESNPFIKLGRIQKGVEEKMGISLSTDVSIYLLESMANDFARDYPSSYLSLIEEMGNVIKKPDAFAFDPHSGELTFFRLYPKGTELFLLKIPVKQVGRPKRWIIQRFSASKPLQEKGDAPLYFHRLAREKKGKEEQM